MLKHALVIAFFHEQPRLYFMHGAGGKAGAMPISTSRAKNRG